MAADVGAELSSIATALTELTRRITSLAERNSETDDDPVAHALFEVERTLGEALRKLDRLQRAGGA